MLSLTLQRFLQVNSLLFWHLPPINYSLDLFLDVSIRFFKGISLSIEHVDIIVQWMVLFFSFDKSSDNLLDIWNAGSFFDLLESILDNFYIPHVLVHQSLLLFVGCDYLTQPQLENGNGVAEIWSFSFVLGLLVTGVKVLIIELNHFIFLFQPVS